MKNILNFYIAIQFINFNIVFLFMLDNISHINSAIESISISCGFNLCKKFIINASLSINSSTRLKYNHLMKTSTIPVELFHLLALSN
jgi:hypothetical protein